MPGMGPMIAVRTDMEAFERDGIMPMQGNRQIRRNMYRSSMGPSMGSPMGPMTERYAPSGGYLSAMGGGSSPTNPAMTVTVNKLE